MIFICYFVEFSRMFFVDNSKVKARDLNLHSKKKKKKKLELSRKLHACTYWILFIIIS